MGASFPSSQPFFSAVALLDSSAATSLCKHSDLGLFPCTQVIYSICTRFFYMPLRDPDSLMLIGPHLLALTSAFTCNYSFLFSGSDLFWVSEHWAFVYVQHDSGEWLIKAVYITITTHVVDIQPDRPDCHGSSCRTSKSTTCAFDLAALKEDHNNLHAYVFGIISIYCIYLFTHCWTLDIYKHQTKEKQNIVAVSLGNQQNV